MATFTVKYRRPDGALAEEVVEADSRSSAFDAARERGIVPISLTSGGKPSAASADTPKRGGNRRLVQGILACAAVVLLAGGVWWMLPRHSPAKPLPPKRIEAKKPLQTKATATPAPAVTNLPKVAEQPRPVEPEADLGEWHGQRVVARTARTNENGTVVQILTTKDGKTHRVTTPPKPVFDNASDQLIAMAVSGAEHDSMAPMPLSASIESDFRKSLEKPVVIDETDSDEVKRMKQAVIEVREELKKVVASGGSVQEALATHQQLVNDNGRLRAQAQAEIRRYMDEGDVEGARNYVKTINQALEQMGVKGVSMPMTREERRAVVQEQRKLREAQNAAPEGKKEE